MFIQNLNGIQAKNRVLVLIAMIVIAMIALVGSSTSASAHVSFTPDGIAYIPYAGYEDYLGGDHSHVAFLFTPDGVNQVELLA